MKRYLRLFVLVCVAALTFLTSQQNDTRLSAMDWGQVTQNTAKQRFNSLHSKYDGQFKRDGQWSKASGRSSELYQLNFTRWLFKKGHASELIKETDFNKSAGSYSKMISTWRTLTRTGRFSSTIGANFYKKFTGSNTKVTDLQPVALDNNLQTYVNGVANTKNSLTHKVNENRVNLGIHNPSKERDRVKKAAGKDAKFTEVLYSGTNSNVKPNFEQFIIGYIIDDDNAIPSEEGGHRWILLSSNKYAASAFTQQKGNIINFSTSKVTLTSNQQNDNDRVNKALLRLGNNAQTVVFYDSQQTNTPWKDAHLVTFVRGNYNSLLRTFKRGAVFKIGRTKYKAVSQSPRFSWAGTGVNLPNEVFIKIVKA